MCVAQISDRLYWSLSNLAPQIFTQDRTGPRTPPSFTTPKRILEVHVLRKFEVKHEAGGFNIILKLNSKNTFQLWTSLADYFLIGHSRPFFFIFVYPIQFTVNKHSLKVCRWLDSNCGLLVSEATALPTETQSLIICFTYNKIRDRFLTKD